MTRCQPDHLARSWSGSVTETVRQIYCQISFYKLLGCCWILGLRPPLSMLSFTRKSRYICRPSRSVRSILVISIVKSAGIFVVSDYFVLLAVNCNLSGLVLQLWSILLPDHYTDATPTKIFTGPDQKLKYESVYKKYKWWILSVRKLFEEILTKTGQSSGCMTFKNPQKLSNFWVMIQSILKIIS